MVIDLTPVQIEGILFLILVVPIFAAFVITLRHLLQRRSLHTLFFMLAWGMYVIWGIANGLLFFIGDPFFAFLGAYSTIPLAFFTVLFFDCISREGVSTIKMIVLMGLSTIKCVLLVQPGAVQTYPYPGGFEKLGLSSPLLIVGSALTSTLGAWYVYYMARIRRNVPVGMRRPAGMSVLGAIAMGLGGPLAAAFSVNLAIIISVGIGAILTSVAFTRQPHLAYVLPFRVFRLAVLDNCSGMQLFTHDWSRASNSFNPTLFAGMFQGLNGILRETLQQGFPREIHLEHAVILLERTEGIPLTFVLFASKKSSYLRRALHSFSTMFYQQFYTPDSQPRGIITMDYSPAEELLINAFPFIPNYLEDATG